MLKKSLEQESGEPDAGPLEHWSDEVEVNVVEDGCNQQHWNDDSRERDGFKIWQVRDGLTQAVAKTDWLIKWNNHSQVIEFEVEKQKDRICVHSKCLSAWIFTLVSLR